MDLQIDRETDQMERQTKQIEQLDRKRDQIDGRWRDWWIDKLIHKNEKEIWVEK